MQEERGDGEEQDRAGRGGSRPIATLRHRRRSPAMQPTSSGLTHGEQAPGRTHRRAEPAAHRDRIGVGQHRALHRDRRSTWRCRRRTGRQKNMNALTASPEQKTAIAEDHARDADDRPPPVAVGQPSHGHRTEHDERAGGTTEEHDHPVADAEVSRMSGARTASAAPSSSSREFSARSTSEDRRATELESRAQARSSPPPTPGQQVVGEDDPFGSRVALGPGLLVEDRAGQARDRRRGAVPRERARPGRSCQRPHLDGGPGRHHLAGGGIDVYTPMASPTLCLSGPSEPYGMPGRSSSPSASAAAFRRLGGEVVTGTVGGQHEQAEGGALAGDAVEASPSWRWPGRASRSGPLSLYSSAHSMTPGSARAAPRPWARTGAATRTRARVAASMPSASTTPALSAWAQVDRMRSGAQPPAGTRP